MSVCDFSLHQGSTESRKTLEQKFIFEIGILILTVSTNTSHSTNLFCCFSRCQAPTNSVKLHIPVYRKIKQHLKPLEVRPPIVNQQSLVYQFKCDLCDAGYIGYTRRHLHQRVDGHKNASCSIGKHFPLEHSYLPNELTRNFPILKKCKSKFDCLIYETFN